MQAERMSTVLLSLAAIAVLLIATAAKTPTAGYSQDQSFRLINIERRLDQLQSRLDFLERAQQNQLVNNAGLSNVSTQAVLELQRQQLSLAEQIVTMQRRLLEMQKTIDQLAEHNGAPAKPAPEKKEPPKSDAKPKTPSGRP